MVAALIAGIFFAHPRVQDPAPGKIVFVSDRDGNREIYSMRSDGTNVKRLTNSLGDDVEPCWSPDGGRIAWASNRSGGWHIWLMNSDGSNQHVLNDAPKFTDRKPMWSGGDPKRVAFLSNRRFYTIKADGSEMQMHFELILNYDCQPAVSPIALRFAYLDPNGHLQVKEGWEYLKQLPLAYGRNGLPPKAFNPSWSSDGAQLVFDSGGATSKVFTIDMVDYETEPVVMQGNGYDAVFANQDTAVIFTGPTGTGTGTDLYLVDIDAAGRSHELPKPTNLTQSPGNDSQAAYWEPKVED